MKPAFLLALVIAILSGCRTADTLRSAIPEGSRAISIALSAETSSEIRSNDHIDLFAGSKLLCSNVVVLAADKNAPWSSVTLQLTEKQTEQLVAAQQQAGALNIQVRNEEDS